MAETPAGPAQYDMMQYQQMQYTAMQHQMQNMAQYAQMAQMAMMPMVNLMGDQIAVCPHFGAGACPGDECPNQMAHPPHHVQVC